jgi:hypothetical protein
MLVSYHNIKRSHDPEDFDLNQKFLIHFQYTYMGTLCVLILYDFKYKKKFPSMFSLALQTHQVCNFFRARATAENTGQFEFLVPHGVS